MNINVHFYVGQMEVHNVEVQNTFLPNHLNVKYEKKKNISTLQVQNSDNFTLNESAAEENEEAEHPEVDRVVEEVLVVGPLGAGGVAGVKRQY